jgi:cytoplasmic iron level regulating protein YaaA (DUF328/UPF0246 family)
VHLLLPPSEGKTRGGRGRPLRHRHADDGPLAAARRTTLAALQQLLATATPPTAAEALLLPAGVAADALATNAAVLDSPTTPALRRYAGVVYDGLGYAELTPAEQRVAGRSCWVFSGLFGVVRGDEPVPEYRVPAKAVLPAVGGAGTYWRPVLSELLPDLLRRGLIVDLRSSDYAAMWRPDPATAKRVVGVRVLSPAPRGGHAVISYNSKFAKGRLIAELVRRVAAGGTVRTVDDVAEAWLRWPSAADAVPTPAGLDLYTR